MTTRLRQFANVILVKKQIPTATSVRCARHKFASVNAAGTISNDQNCNVIYLAILFQRLLREMCEFIGPSNHSVSALQFKLKDSGYQEDFEEEFGMNLFKLSSFS